MSQQNGHGRIALPNQVRLNIVNVAGNLATPIALPPMGDGATVQAPIVGGLTKLEHGALQIAAGLAAKMTIPNDEDCADYAKSVSDFAFLAVTLAAETLGAAARLQQHLDQAAQARQQQPNTSPIIGSE